MLAAAGEGRAGAGVGAGVIAGGAGFDWLTAGAVLFAGADCAAGAGFDWLIAGAALFAGADCAAGAAAAGAEDPAANQLWPPLWPLHAPAFFGAFVYVPSLHCPVEPAGACAIATCDANPRTKLPMIDSLFFTLHHPVRNLGSSA